MTGLEAEGWGSCVQVGRARPAIVHVVSVPATGQGGGVGGCPRHQPPDLHHPHGPRALRADDHNLLPFSTSGMLTRSTPSLVSW